MAALTRQGQQGERGWRILGEAGRRLSRIWGVRSERKGHEDTRLSSYKTGWDKEYRRVDQVSGRGVGRMKTWDLPALRWLQASCAPVWQLSVRLWESESGTREMKLGWDYWSTCLPRYVCSIWCHSFLPCFAHCPSPDRKSSRSCMVQGLGVQTD